jgi:division protein CdvB (Snf7/Vps24/ESCRT-III family)
MPQNNNPLNESIDDIKGFKEKLKEATKFTEDVKNGDATPEDEQQEPDYILYQAIADSSIQIMQMDEVINLFSKLSSKLTEPLTKDLITLLTIVMTNSSYNAISFYDNLLKDELQAQFQAICDAFNQMAGEVHAHTGVFEVYKKRLDTIESRLNKLESK